MSRLLQVVTSTALLAWRPVAAATRRQDLQSVLEHSTKSGTTMEMAGLWVCDPNIRHMLERSGASISAGELLGRCRETFTGEACDAARRILSRGPSVIESLNELCGQSYDVPDSSSVTGSGSSFRMSGGSGTGSGLGPLQNGVTLPADKIARALLGRTGFHGPDSPPGRSDMTMDASVRRKKQSGTFGGPSGFRWEKSTSGNTTSMDNAAEAVRIFNQLGLAGGSSPREGTDYYPQTVNSRQAHIEEELEGVRVLHGSNLSFPLSVEEKALASQVAIEATKKYQDLDVPFEWNSRPGKWLPPGITVLRLPNSDSVQMCQDTESWSNDAAKLGAHVGMHPQDADEGVFRVDGDKPGWTCKAYGEDYWAWCSAGKVLEAGAAGETFNYPENHCCDCGGGRRWVVERSELDTFSIDEYSSAGTDTTKTVQGTASDPLF